MPRFTSFAGYAILLVLAIVSWWATQYFKPDEPAPVQAQPGKVDYFSKELRRMVMDETGKPKELLVAEELIHYENDKHSEVSRPVMTLYSQNAPPWVIEAESATVPEDSDLVHLNGDVLLTRERDKNGRTVRIETSNARVQPDQDYAETDEFIRVLSPPDIMTGTGAKVYFGENIRYTVLANVRRKHETE